MDQEIVEKLTTVEKSQEDIHSRAVELSKRIDKLEVGQVRNLIFTLFNFFFHKKLI